MRSSDNKPKTGSRRGTILSRIGVLAAAAAVLLCMEGVARVCFDGAHYADYYNYEISQMEKNGETVGMVIGGASQVYHACDTNILAEKLGYENVVAASSAGQVTDGTYYMVRDIVNRFAPEYVVVGMSWDRFFQKKLKSLHGGRLLAADHIPFADRVEYFLKCAPVGQWFNLSDLYRFGGAVKSLDQLKQNYTIRKQVASGDWNIDTSAVSYYGKNGYIVFSRGAQEGQMWAEELTFDESKVLDRELEYMKKIAQLCKDRNIKLIWMTLPSTLAEIYSIDNYQEAVDYMTTFLESTGFPYLNFSMLKNREEIFPDTVFSDHIHLAEEGAHRFSEIFADMVLRMEKGEDVSDQFYSSVEEMKKDVHRIVGSFLQVIHLNRGGYRAMLRSHQNDDITPQYRLLKQADGEWELLSDWQEEKILEFSEDELKVGERIRLEVRQKGSDQIQAFWETTVIEQDELGEVEEVFDEAE